MKHYENMHVSQDVTFKTLKELVTADLMKLEKS